MHGIDGLFRHGTRLHAATPTRSIMPSFQNGASLINYNSVAPHFGRHDTTRALDRQSALQISKAYRVKWQCRSRPRGEGLRTISLGKLRACFSAGKLLAGLFDGTRGK